MSRKSKAPPEADMTRVFRIPAPVLNLSKPQADLALLWLWPHVSHLYRS